MLAMYIGLITGIIKYKDLRLLCINKRYDLQYVISFIKHHITIYNSTYELQNWGSVFSYVRTF